MAAQNPAVGIAVAAYYPSLSYRHRRAFCSRPWPACPPANHVWSNGAAGSETLFDFGERHAGVEAAKALMRRRRELSRHRPLCFSSWRTPNRACASSPNRRRRSTSPYATPERGSQIALAEFQAGTVDYTTVAWLRRPCWPTSKARSRAAESPHRRGVLDRRLGRRLVDSQLHDPLRPNKRTPANATP